MKDNIKYLKVILDMKDFILAREKEDFLSYQGLIVVRGGPASEVSYLLYLMMI